MFDPYQVVRDFEAAVAAYTGAPFVVSVNSCTMALLLACSWVKYKHPKPAHRDAWNWLEIPAKTYISVPMSIIHAGFNVVFRDEEWSGSYQLKPLPVWDSARRFTSSMYQPGQMQCCSFHSSKILADTQGGCVLHDNPEADAWLRKARFDGRTEGVSPKDDTFDMLGWHCYLSSDVAARLLLKLSVLPEVNSDLPNDDYPDLSKCEIFK
jgi:dTDP-4-amino-4,6-dideoxygalactose transaminase